MASSQFRQLFLFGHLGFKATYPSFQEESFSFLGLLEKNPTTCWEMNIKESERFGIKRGGKQVGHVGYFKAILAKKKCVFLLITNLFKVTKVYGYF